MDKPQALAEQTLLRQLQDSGVTEVQVGQDPVWIIARAPSGNRVQVLWAEASGEYWVSLLDSGKGTVLLGRFPKQDDAVACALDA
jgi:hypothetical protein